jgi:lysozyme family protein
MISDGLLIQRYTHYWNVMKINPGVIPYADSAAKLLITGRDKFQELSTLTHVPWGIIAVIGYREYGFLYEKGKPPVLQWDKSLAQGDAWNTKSVHEPKGRGPFDSWLKAGYDALVNCPPFAAKWRDWSPGAACALLVKYNGEGYDNMGVPDPYILSGTDQYIKGKYSSDGRYDPQLVDKELGCAVLISRMETLLGKSS